MTIVEAARGITGGVDTHRDVHVAAALDPLGGLLGSESLPHRLGRLQGAAAWLRAFGDVTKIGIEGTGSYGSGLTRYLRRAGVRSSKSTGRIEKSDAAVASPIPSMPSKQRGRLSVVGRPAAPSPETAPSRPSECWWWRSAPLGRPESKRSSRCATSAYSAPEQLRCRLKGLSVPALVAEGRHSDRPGHPIR